MELLSLIVICVCVDTHRLNIFINFRYTFSFSLRCFYCPQKWKMRNQANGIARSKNHLILTTVWAVEITHSISFCSKICSTSRMANKVFRRLELKIFECCVTLFSSLDTKLFLYFSQKKEITCRLFAYISMIVKKQFIFEAKM